MKSTRIAILDCDDKVPEVARIHGLRYSDTFAALLTAASIRLGNPSRLVFHAYDVRQGIFPPPSSFDAIIVTGGVAAAYHSDAWIVKLGQFIRQTYELHADVRLFGVCFGHQLIAQALLGDSGVVVELNPHGQQFGIKSIQLNPLYLPYLPPANQHLKEIKIQVIHGDHVRLPKTPLPEGWLSIGSTTCCDNHGLYLHNRIFTMQSHFELDQVMTSKLIEYFFTPEKGYSAELIEAAVASAQGDIDSLWIAELVLQFLIGDTASAMQNEMAEKETFDSFSQPQVVCAA